MTRGALGQHLFSSVRITLLVLTALVGLFELELIRDVLMNGDKYRFGSEAGGFPYRSEGHYVGLAAAHLLAAVVGVVLGLSHRDRWWPLAIQAVTIAWLVASPLIWSK